MNTMNSDTSLFSSNFPYYIEGRNAYLDASVWVNDLFTQHNWFVQKPWFIQEQNKWLFINK